MKINFRIPLLSAGLISAALLTGCGGGGSSSPSAVAPPDNTIGGTAAVGPILDAKVLVFRAGTDDPNDDTKALNATSPASTDGTGKYNVNVGSYAGPLIVKVIAKATSKMCDEVTGRCDLAMPANFQLRAALPSVGANTVAHITPFTEIAAKALGTDLSVGKINAANAAVRVNVLGGLDPLTIKPVVDNSTAYTDTQRLDQKNMVLMLAAVNNADVDGTCSVKVSGEKIQCAVDGLRGMLTAVSATTSTVDATKLASFKNALMGLGSVYIPTLNADGTLRTNIDGTLSADTKVTTAADVAAQSRQDVMAGVTAGEHPLPNTTQLSGVDQAKSFFRDLRTTVNLYANGSKNGFMDNQSVRFNADINANVAPVMSRVAGRLSALGKTMGVFEDGKAYTASNTYGLVQGRSYAIASPNVPSTPALVRQFGSPYDVIYGIGTFDFCWTDSATGVTNKVTCAHAGPGSVDWANNRIMLVVVELTGTTTNQYTYTATRYNMAMSNGAITLATGIPTGSGTAAKTVSGTSVTGLMLNGTLPPSATTSSGTATTGVDTVAISAARTALTATNNYRYALTGSVSTSNLADSSKVVTVSFDSGSYIDQDETDPATASDNQIVAARLIGTAKTAATQFTGTLDARAFMWDLHSRSRFPTVLTLNGAFSDTSSGGAGKVMTGQLELVATNYGQFDTTQPESASNYLKGHATFTGTLYYTNAPSLVLNMARTGVDTTTAIFSLAFGSGRTVTGSTTLTKGATNSITLSNQDGINVTLVENDSTDKDVKLNGETIATIKGGEKIYYKDGTFESLM